MAVRVSKTDFEEKVQFFLNVIDIGKKVFSMECENRRYICIH